MALLFLALNNLKVQYHTPSFHPPLPSRHAHTHILGLSGHVPSWGGFGLRAKARRGPFKIEPANKTPHWWSFHSGHKRLTPTSKSSEVTQHDSGCTNKAVGPDGHHLKLGEAHSPLLLFQIQESIWLAQFGFKRHLIFSNINCTEHYQMRTKCELNWAGTNDTNFATSTLLNWMK